MDSKTSPSFTKPTLTQAPMVSTNKEQVVSQTTEAVKDVVFGSVAGMVGKVVEYPFDTVKVRLQSQPDHLPLRYAGPLDCFRQSIRQDGVKGLYRGVSAPLLGAAAETSCLFLSYRVAKDVIRVFNGTSSTKKADEELPLSSLVTAGAMSGAVTSLVLTPIELVKCRMQVPLTSTMDPTLRNATTGPLAVIGDVYRREGLAGFWRGQLGTLFRETGGGAAWFGCYEASSLFFKQRAKAATGKDDPKLPIWQSMLAGAGAGLGYNFSFYPADTIKARMQTGDLTSIGANGEKQTFMSVGRALYRTHGLRGLYRGCGITLLRSVPSSALIFTIYESLNAYFG